MINYFTDYSFIHKNQKIPNTSGYIAEKAIGKTEDEIIIIFLSLPESLLKVNAIIPKTATNMIIINICI